MKKLNVSKASKIVGGLGFCESTYESSVVNDVTVCRKVTTCEGKFGPIKTQVPADLSQCS